MRFRKIALALFACLALGAIAANVAQAGQWTLGTTENQTTAGTKITSESVSCKKHGTSELALTSKFLGAAVKLTATGIDCVNATIDSTAGGVAHSAGTLKFTGVSVVEPKGCSVGGVNHELSTEALTDEVIMDPTAGSTTVFDKFFPETSGGAFVTITFEGAECVIAGTPVPVKGTACGEAVHTNTAGTGYEPNHTGTLTKVQTLLFGSGQQTTGGCELKLGNEKAQLAGAVDNELSGSNAGKPFGAD
jgi:hypothetical protein